MEHSQFVWWLTGGEYQVTLGNLTWLAGRLCLCCFSTSRNGDSDLPQLANPYFPTFSSQICGLKSEYRFVGNHLGKGYKGVTFPNSMPLLGMIFPLLIMMRSTRGFLFEMLQCSVAATRAIPMSSTTPNVPGL